jgi:hypothetical protein
MSEIIGIPIDTPPTGPPVQVTPDPYPAEIAEVRAMIADEVALDLSDDLIRKALKTTEYRYEGENGVEAVEFDHWAAAGLALRLLAARYKTQYDFQSNDQRFSLSQKFDHCLTLASQFESVSHITGGYMARQGQITTISMERTDTWL